MKTIAFFNNKAGVGKTSLVYHVAWTLADLGLKVLVADLDPQANLSSIFIDEERLGELWPDDEHPDTVFGAIRPILRGTGDLAPAHIEDINDSIGLLVGDLALSSFEDNLSQAWPSCLDRKENAFRVISAFYRMLLGAAKRHEAQVVLIDVGPNLGAINRAALLSAEHVVVPLAPDLFSLQGLRNLGPRLNEWRQDWNERLAKAPSELSLPSGHMRPAGYVVLQHNMRLDRPVRAYSKWMERIPSEYQRSVLRLQRIKETSVEDDPNCLALIKHYRSLMPMAMEARKPIFHLKPADGALGAHVAAAHQCGSNFRELTQAIAQKCGLKI